MTSLPGLKKPWRAVTPAILSSSNDAIRGLAPFDGLSDGLRAPHKVERVAAPVCSELESAWIEALNRTQDVYCGRCGLELPRVGQDQPHAALPVIPGAGPDRFKPHPP